MKNLVVEDDIDWDVLVMQPSKLCSLHSSLEPA